MREALEKLTAYCEGYFNDGYVPVFVKAARAALSTKQEGEGCLSGRDAPSDEYRNAVLEEAAKAVEPKQKQPCDCIKRDGQFWTCSCYCSNYDDNAWAAQWCESQNNAEAIRALSRKAPS